MKGQCSMADNNNRGFTPADNEDDRKEISRKGGQSTQDGSRSDNNDQSDSQ